MDLLGEDVGDSEHIADLGKVMEEDLLLLDEALPARDALHLGEGLQDAGWWEERTCATSAILASLDMYVLVSWTRVSKASPLM